MYMLLLRLLLLLAGGQYLMCLQHSWKLKVDAARSTFQMTRQWRLLLVSLSCQLHPDPEAAPSPGHMLAARHPPHAWAHTRPRPGISMKTATQGVVLTARCDHSPSETAVPAQWRVLHLLKVCQLPWLHTQTLLWHPQV
jgi:hypothetical protein